MNYHPPPDLMHNLRVSMNWMVIGLLKPDPKAPRKHNRKQRRQIATAIRRFGFLVPIVVDQNNKIVCGHGRYLAATDLGLSEVPVVKVDHLAPAELRALQVADNQLVLNGDWDLGLLKTALVEIVDADISLDLDPEITGLDYGEIEAIISDEPAPDEADSLPPVIEGPPVCRKGNLWRLGRHRLICGNSLEAAVYIQLFEGLVADVIFTDPPYNVKIDGHVSGLGKVKHREFDMATGEMSVSEFVQFLAAVMALMVKHSKEGSIHYICMDWRHMFELLSAAQGIYTALKNICVWAKDNGGMGSLYRSQHEMVAVYKNGDKPHQNNVQLGKNGRNRTNVWFYPGSSTLSRQSSEGRLLELHPTVKPVQMVVDALLDVSKRGQIVLDPFGGSGTTVIAAERTGRRCFAIELDAQYCDTIIRRWQAWTGEDAIEEATGKTFNQLMNESEESND